MPHEDGAEPASDGSTPDRPAPIILLYVRPACEGVTELDRRVGLIAERYATWVELVVVRPEELAGSPLLKRPAELEVRPAAGGGSSSISPALLLLRDGEVVGEAMGALLPSRELDHVVRCAVEWPAPL
ncbi:MAG TPA: hypothetical protein VK698_05625 [Kofleriaceae bacterium]|nr:hypothetical protein [Kofleriaceae bacterium]